MAYNQTPEGRARRQTPWTCPKCNRTMKAAGKGPHSVSCAKDPVAHFWSRADKNGAGGCWIFNGCRDKWGYAQHGINCRRVQAHRHAYKLTHGSIPVGQLVMHTCDNPPCVNPEHLRLGTDADNCDDKVAKRRHVHGERMHTAKLTAADVLEIRSLKGKVLQKEIARQYGLSLAYVSNLWARRTWKHLP